MKIKIKELRELYSGLVQLGNENLPIAYAIGKNLNKIESELRKVDKDISKMRDLLLAKDEAGNPVKFVIEDGDFLMIDGNRVIATSSFKPAPNQIVSTAVAEDKTEEFQEGIQTIEESEISVEFYKITAAKAQELENKPTKGNLLKVLFKYDLIEE